MRVAGIFRALAPAVLLFALTAPARPAPGEEQESTSAEVNALFAGAVKMLKENHPFQARQLLERAAELEPNSPTVRCNLGLAYQNSGNINRAISEFQRALELAPDMPQATLNLAGCYQSLGRSREAISWFEKYLQLSPQSAEAGQVRDIIAQLRAAAEQPGSDPGAPDYLQAVTAGGTYRWPQHKLPLKVYIAPGRGAQGFRASFRQALVEAFEAWAAASGDRLSCVLVTDPLSADVACDWTNDAQEVSKAGTQGERGIAWVVADEADEIKRATIKILTIPTFAGGVLSDDDMKKACLHEVGHVLGLQGHSTNNHDVMFFTIDAATVWPVLSRRDRATIARLYAAYPVLTRQAR